MWLFFPVGDMPSSVSHSFQPGLNMSTPVIHIWEYNCLTPLICVMVMCYCFKLKSVGEVGFSVPLIIQRWKWSGQSRWPSRHLLQQSPCCPSSWVLLLLFSSCDYQILSLSSLLCFLRCIRDIKFSPRHRVIKMQDLWGWLSKDFCSPRGTRSESLRFRGPAARWGSVPAVTAPTATWWQSDSVLEALTSSHAAIPFFSNAQILLSSQSCWQTLNQESLFKFEITGYSFQNSAALFKYPADWALCRDFHLAATLLGVLFSCLPSSPEEAGKTRKDRPKKRAHFLKPMGSKFWDGRRWKISGISFILVGKCRRTCISITCYL